jgi:hypothetical protein
MRTKKPDENKKCGVTEGKGKPSPYNLGCPQAHLVGAGLAPALGTPARGLASPCTLS